MKLSILFQILRFLFMTSQLLERWTFITWKSIISHHPPGTCPESLKLATPLSNQDINLTPHLIRLEVVCFLIAFSIDAICFRIFSEKTWCFHTVTRRDTVSGSGRPSCFPRTWTRASLTAALQTSLQWFTNTGCSTVCRASTSGSLNWITSASTPSKRSGMGCQDYLGSNWHLNVLKFRVHD